MSDRRIEPLRRRLADEGLDALIVSGPTNIGFLTGLARLLDGEDAHALVISPERATLYTDSRYYEALRQAAGSTGVEVSLVRENLYVTVCERLEASGVDSVAIEANVPYGRFRFISERFSGHVEVVDGWVEHLRQVKEPDELACIEAAAALADRAFAYIVERAVPGASEWELALELEVFMRREGSDGVAFPPIVASGPNSALPHARVTRREIEHGDLVIIDLGARVDGYCSDMTRTIVAGRATERQREIHAAVLEANLAGIAAVRAGVPGNVIDAQARDLLDRRGFGEYFGHGLGHGVGLEVHESPSVSPRVTRSVPANSVITIEPGVYVPGYGGVRIEDLVVVEEQGARALSLSAKELIETA